MSSSNLNPETESLIQGFLEESLSDDEAVLLKAEIIRQPELVNVILHQLRDESLIKDHVRRQEQIEHMLAPSESLVKENDHHQRADTPSVPALPISRRLFQRQTRVRSLGLVGSLVAVLVLVFVYSRTPAPTFSRLSNSSGIYVERNGQTVVASEINLLRAGDTIHVESESEAVIQFANEKTELTLQPDTSFVLTSWRSQKRFDLKHGSILARVGPQKNAAPLTVNTPTASVEVLGTELGVGAGQEQTRLAVWEGKVRLTRNHDSFSMDVPAGNEVVASEEAMDIHPLTKRYPPGIVGSILHEYWEYIPGTNVADITRHPRFPNAPDASNELKRFRIPEQWHAFHGSRIHGWLYPNRSGNYTFWIAADDSAELWLSSNESPNSKSLLATVQVATEPDDFDHAPEQRSKTVFLKSGHRYYIEVIHKQATQPGGLSVAWQSDEGSRTVVKGSDLAPFRNLGLKTEK